MTKILEKPDSFYDSFTRKPAQQGTTHYCPGCGHGILNKLIGEAISDLEIQDQTLMVGPVGCGVFLYYYYDVAAVSSPHGRASAVGTGVARANPDGVTIVYQGDGDLAAIGTNNAIHAANRGENMIVFFVNNTVYGMTGGQLAPTTLIGQKTTTSPYGRTEKNDGQPLRMAEIMATLDGPVLVARVAVNNPKNVMQARKVIRKGLQAQKDKLGYVFIEVLAQCPTNWRLSPEESCQYLDDVVAEYFPMKVFKDKIEEATPLGRDLKESNYEEVLEVIGAKEMQERDVEIAPLPYPEVRLTSAGFGGQGVLSLGLLIAEIQMKRGREVTWLPSYGPEMRGGVANCGVVISDQSIGSPVVENPNILIAMNKPSTDKFAVLVPEDGLILYNSSMVDELPKGIKTSQVYPIDATGMAKKAGNVKAANSAMLGALARLTGLLTLEELSDFITYYFPKSEIGDINRKLSHLGWDAVSEPREV